MALEVSYNTGGYKLHIRKVRILHVIGVMDRGGAEAMIMNLYRQIDRSRIQFDFVVHTGREGVFDSEITELGGRIYHCPRYKGTNHIEYLHWWSFFFKRYKEVYSIVHGHIGSTAAIYLGIAKRFGLLTIAHSHNTNGRLTPREVAYRIFSYRTRFVADYLFACSRQAGIDRFGRKASLDSERFRVFPNAIDTKLFAFNEVVRNRIRKGLGIEDDCLLIGHVGRFQKVKNHSFILMIFDDLLRKDKKSRLILVGDGSLRNEIEEQAELMGIREAIIFTGVREDVHALMQAMDVMLFPSLYEGLPVTLVEAQTAGLPIVMSEHVPKDTILIKELVTVDSLKSPVGAWVQDILAAAKTERKDRKEEIAAEGFDIKTTAKWLEEFYIEKGSR